MEKGQEGIKTDPLARLREINAETARLAEEKQKILEGGLGATDIREVMEAFDTPTVVWVGRMDGETRVDVEGKDFDPNQFDHRLVISNGQADVVFATDISPSLSLDGWDKYYVCASREIAQHLISKINPDKLMSQRARDLK